MSEKDRRVHEQGLVSVLRQIHDDLDAAVADAYGWPADLPDDELLRRLVALNAERAAEERRGLVRWLRPEFQNPGGAGTTQLELKPAKDPAATKGKPAAKPAWPKSLAEQARGVRAALQARPDPATPDDVAASFKGGRRQQVADLLDTLVTLGQARRTVEGRYVA